MDSDNFLLAIAVIAVLVSIVGMTVTYNSVSTFENLFTGFVTENGTVNITIESQVIINITHANESEGSDILNWGPGYVTGSNGYALVASNGTVTDGTWDTIDEGFRIKNVGTVNVSLNISSDKTATDFVGAGALFQYNLSNYDAGSCDDFGSYIEGTYTEFTTTSTPVCDDFKYATPDVLLLDIMIKVPDTATPTEKTATVILSYDGLA